MASTTVDVSRGQIVQAFVVAAVIIVIYEASDLGLEIAGGIVVLQQDAVLHGLVPALDLALGHRMIWRATDMRDGVAFEPDGKVAGDVAGTVVRQQPRAVNDTRAIKA